METRSGRSVSPHPEEASPEGSEQEERAEPSPRAAKRCEATSEGRWRQQRRQRRRRRHAASVPAAAGAQRADQAASCQLPPLPRRRDTAGTTGVTARAGPRSPRGRGRGAGAGGSAAEGRPLTDSQAYTLLALALVLAALPCIVAPKLVSGRRAAQWM